MKQRLKPQFSTNWGFLQIGFLLLWAFVIGCSSQSEEDFWRARSESEGGRHESALAIIDRGLARVHQPKEGLNLAREGARIAFFELKRYEQAIRFNRFLVLNSSDQNERIEAQKQIISIYFNNLNDYKRVIPEIHRLLNLGQLNEDPISYNVMLAKSHYYLEDFNQAESEADEYLRRPISENHRYELLLLKANIANARKKPEAAVQIIEQMIRDYPDKAKKDGLRLTLTVAYEESGQLDKAIQELRRMKEEVSAGADLEQRIQRLEDRKINQPGRRGRRK